MTFWMAWKKKKKQKEGVQGDEKRFVDSVLHCVPFFYKHYGTASIYRTQFIQWHVKITELEWGD